MAAAWYTQAFAAAGGSGPVKGISDSCTDGGVVKQAFPGSMKADALAYFGTTAPQESDTGLPSFPLFCPNRCRSCSGLARVAVASVITVRHGRGLGCAASI